MATTKKAPTVSADDLFWETEHKGRASAQLSSFQGPVPIARVAYTGGKKTAGALAQDIARDIPEIREVTVSNRYITLYVVNNGIMREEEANELRDLFIADFTNVANGRPKRSDAEDEDNDVRNPRLKFHRAPHGAQRRFGGGPG